MKFSVRWKELSIFQVFLVNLTVHRTFLTFLWRFLSPILIIACNTNCQPHGLWWTSWEGAGPARRLGARRPLAPSALTFPRYPPTLNTWLPHRESTKTTKTSATKSKFAKGEGGAEKEKCLIVNYFCFGIFGSFSSKLQVFIDILIPII